MYSYSPSFNQKSISVSKLHTLHVEQFGNPDGVPVVYLHGGPGAGCSFQEARYFDPDFYRVILFDQRGSGKSQPYACVEEQGTDLLVSDIEVVREALGIERWAVLGGSWGSVLAMRYAQAHRDRVTRMCLRGMWFGNADGTRNISEDGGTNLVVPDYWEQYAGWDRVRDRKDLIGSYDDLLKSEDPALRIEAVRRFMVWDTSIASARPRQDWIDAVEENPEAALSMSRFWFHYARYEFLKTDGVELLSEPAFVDLPIDVVHGSDDWICRVENAHRFKVSYSHVNLNVIAGGGHCMADPLISAAVMDVLERWKKDLCSVSLNDPALKIG